MSKKKLRNIAFLALIGLAASASAVPIVDVYDPPSDVPISVGSPLSFTHDIVGEGFVAGLDTVASATLTIHLNDPPGGGAESFVFQIGSAQSGNGSGVNSGSGADYPFTLSQLSLGDLNDGQINVSITATSGDFLFADSTLTVNLAERPTDIGALTPTPAIPEPMPLALMGLGILAIGSTRHRKEW